MLILALLHYQLHIWTAFKASAALAGHVFVVTPSYPPCWTGHADMSGHHLHLPIFTRGTIFLIEVKCGLLMPLQLPKHRGRILIFSFVLCSNVVYVFPCNPHTCKYRRVLKGKSAESLLTYIFTEQTVTTRLSNLCTFFFCLIGDAKIDDWIQTFDCHLFLIFCDSTWRSNHWQWTWDLWFFFFFLKGTTLDPRFWLK